MLIYGYAALAFGLIFLVILTLLHFLKPELSPVWRMISEYEIGRFGWLMRVAFFCWGASVLSLLILIWPLLGTVSGLIGRWWLVVIVIALFGAGVFKTDPITAITNNPIHVLHTICGVITILTFPIAATLAANGLLHNNSWSSAQGQLILGTLLVWIGMLAFFASLIISGMIDPSAVKGGPNVYQGWPNRFMVVTYILWLLIVSGNALAILARA